MAVSRNDQAGDVHYHTGMGYYLNGEIALAYGELMLAKNAECQRADLYWALGKIESDYGYEAKALELLSRANDLSFPAEPDQRIWLAYGALLTATHRFEEAEPFFDELRRNVNSESLVHIANLYITKKDFLEEQMLLSGQKDPELIRIMSECTLQANECFESLNSLPLPSDLKSQATFVARQLLGKLTQLKILTDECEESAVSNDDRELSIISKTAAIKEAIVHLNSLPYKTAEARVILFIAHCRLKQYCIGIDERSKDQASDAFNALIRLFIDTQELGLYKSIPAYLKRVFIEEIVCWPGVDVGVVDNIKKVVAVFPSDFLKRLKTMIVNFLCETAEENVTTRLMQMNAALLSLSAKSLFGRVLFTSRGAMSAYLTRGSLAELVQRLTANLAIDKERGIKLLICENTNRALQECKLELSMLPTVELYIAVFNSLPENYKPAVSQPLLLANAPQAPVTASVGWWPSLFGGKAEPAAAPVSLTSRTDTSPDLPSVVTDGRVAARVSSRTLINQGD